MKLIKVLFLLMVSAVFLSSCKKEEVPPEADFSFSPASPIAEEVIQFTDNSDEGSSVITDWNWTFGDGGAASTLQNPTHSYSVEGSFTVKLQVKDAEGLISEVEKTISVSPIPNVDPVSSFSFTPDNQLVGEAVNFTDASTDTDGSIVSWSWDFKNGTTSTDQNPEVYFTDPGTYEVDLTVTDNAGAQNSSTQVVTIKDFPATLEWSFSNESAVDSYNDATRPSIADDGTVYYVEGIGVNSHVVAVTDGGASGSLKWAAAVGVNVKNAPAINTNGDIVIGSWAVPGLTGFSSTDGSVLWSGATGRGISNSSAAIDNNGNIYVSTKGASTAGLYSFASDGTKNWEVLDLGSTYASPALTSDGSVVYFLDTANGLLYAVNTTDGTFNWTEPVDVTDGLGTSLSIDSDGTIYLTTNTQVVAVNDNTTDGAVKWTRDIENPNSSGIVIGPDGTLYTGSQAGLFALNPSDGSVYWSSDIVIEESVPAVDVNGNIYIGTTDGRMVIFNDDGIKIKEFTLGDGTVNSPVISDDGTIYIESYNSVTGVISLNKIKVTDSSPATSPWPMKGKNRKHTSM